MVYGASDLHSRFSQIRLVDADDVILRERRVSSSRDALRTASRMCARCCGRNAFGSARATARAW